MRIVVAITAATGAVYAVRLAALEDCGVERHLILSRWASTSPVAGAWTVFACATCLYAWPSTEPEENTNPDKYPAAFRLKPEELPSLPVAPSIPPLRNPAGG